MYTRYNVNSQKYSTIIVASNVHNAITKYCKRTPNYGGMKCTQRYSVNATKVQDIMVASNVHTMITKYCKRTPNYSGIKCTHRYSVNTKKVHHILVAKNEHTAMTKYCKRTSILQKYITLWSHQMYSPLQRQYYNRTSNYSGIKCTHRYSVNTTTERQITVASNVHPVITSILQQNVKLQWHQMYTPL